MDSKELHWFEKISEEKKQEQAAGSKKKKGVRMKKLVNLEKHIDEVYKWIEDVANNLDGDEMRDDWAYKALRSVLHTLRDRLTPPEVFHLSAQLPIFIRGIYLEGYSLSDKPDKFGWDEMLARINKELSPGIDVKAEDAFRAVIHVLFKHVTPGELNDIRSTMPKDIKEKWDQLVPA